MTRSLWAMVRAGSVMTTKRCATRQAVCSAASVMPTTGQVAISRAASTPVSPKQAMTKASVLSWFSRTWSRMPTAAMVSSAWLSTLGTPTVELTPVTVTPWPATAWAAAVMVAVSSAEVLGLITVMRVIGPPRR